MIGERFGGPALGPVVVLDSEALSVLANADGKPASEVVAAAVKSAHRQNRSVVVPAVVLAETYRNKARVAAANSALKRDSPVHIRHTDEALAIYVGALLDAARTDSCDMVDAHCVAVAVEAGGRGIILTSDNRDLNRLAANHSNIVIKQL